MRAPAALSKVVMLTLVVVLGAALGLACFDTSWKEGIACDGTRCPGSDLTCCRGRCLRQCPALEDAGGSDGPGVVMCPVEVGACFACMPGCACACGAFHGTCCLQLGVATCAGCP